MFRVVLTCCILSAFGIGIFCNGEDVRISFKNATSTFVERETETELLPQAVMKITYLDIPVEVDFLIIQVHSFKYNILLSSMPLMTAENYINGSNIGIFSENRIGTVTVYLKNPHRFNVSCLVVAVPYTSESPVPGGCNIQAPVPIQPYLNLQLSPATISVDGAPASNLDVFKNCNINPFTYILFYKYLPERDFSKKTYFDSIRSMMTYPRILNSSHVGSEQIDGPPLLKIFNKYSGTGTVYSLAVFNSYGNVAIYTPTFTYGCEFDSESESCEILSTPALKIGFAFFITFSAFICYAGHRYFLAELFFMGTLAGGVVAYILLLLQTTYSGDLLLMSTGIGIIFGAIWICVWWCVNRPIISVGLPFLVNGVLVSATVFFFFLSGFKLFQNDFNYWFTFLVLASMVFLISSVNSVPYNMLACSFVGGYGILYPLDYYIGSNLKYIIIDNIRRITIEDFNLAIVSPPLQLADWVMTGIWVLLVVGGYRSQKKLSANRPPFPPICSILREEIPEATPILTNARFPMYT